MLDWHHAVSRKIHISLHAWVGELGRPLLGVHVSPDAFVETGRAQYGRRGRNTRVIQEPLGNNWVNIADGH